MPPTNSLITVREGNGILHLLGLILAGRRFGFAFDIVAAGEEDIRNMQCSCSYVSLAETVGHVFRDRIHAHGINAWCMASLPDSIRTYQTLAAVWIRESPNSDELYISTGRASRGLRLHAYRDTM